MVKIKQKKQLNLPQLIEWAWENDMNGKTFLINGNQVAGIYFDGLCDFKLHNADFIRPSDTFTVEVEEEITEDTVIPKMLEMSFDAYQNVVLDIQVNHSINMVKENAEVLTLHIINDDGTHTLIWRDGKLVD